MIWFIKTFHNDIYIIEKNILSITLHIHRGFDSPNHLQLVVMVTKNNVEIDELYTPWHQYRPRDDIGSEFPRNCRSKITVLCFRCLPQILHGIGTDISNWNNYKFSQANISFYFTWFRHCSEFSILLGWNLPQGCGRPVISAKRTSWGHTHNLIVLQLNCIAMVGLQWLQKIRPGYISEW